MNPLEEAKELLGESFDQDSFWDITVDPRTYRLQEAMLKLIEYIETLQPSPDHRPQHAPQDAHDGR